MTESQRGQAAENRNCPKQADNNQPSPFRWEEPDLQREASRGPWVPLPALPRPPWPGPPRPAAQLLSEICCLCSWVSPWAWDPRLSSFLDFVLKQVRWTWFTVGASCPCV